mmetsp:Transcript_48935/g.115080  ORF Transcript_48935/g.115080 Transcript_48935/m.115080 type:complete len:99 (-) Transcript_48935:140-436(-)
MPTGRVSLQEPARLGKNLRRRSGHILLKCVQGLKELLCGCFEGWRLRLSKVAKRDAQVDSEGRPGALKLLAGGQHDLLVYGPELRAHGYGISWIVCFC